MTASGELPDHRDRIARLLALLNDAGPLGEVDVHLPRGGDTLRITQPQDLDLLIDAVAGDPEQNLPYWAELWPSGIALAAAVTAEPRLVRAQPVLEIGCGLGVTACAALRAGARLTVADYAEAALLLCRLNTLRNAGREPETVRINWRQPPQELFDLAPGGFPVLLAADVLYESRDVKPLLDLVDRLAAPDGILWLAEPRRPVAARFLDAARAAGWSGLSDTYDGPWPDPRDEGVVVNVHLLRRGG